MADKAAIFSARRPSENERGLLLPACASPANDRAIYIAGDSRWTPVFAIKSARLFAFNRHAIAVSHVDRLAKRVLQAPYMQRDTLVNRKGGVLRGRTMLLVEDNPADVLLLETALSEHNLSPQLWVVTDGEQAIKYVEDIDRTGKIGPDLFVLDLNLPKRSGLEVLREIRSSRNCAKTPVVMLSSQDSCQNRTEAKRLGATAYLKKAFDLHDLREIGSKLRVLLHPNLPGEAPSLI